MAMTPLVPMAMFGWIPLVLALFKRLQPRHAVIAGFLLAWMFLPQYDYRLPGLPNYSKISAASYGILLGTWLFNRGAFHRFRAHPFDLPVALWCVAPLLSSLSNGLGLWDGLSAMLGKVTMWGIPYVIGRLYFDHPKALRDLAIGIFLGALIYVPFCLFEVVMSPRLHRIVYGWHPHHFGQTKRGGGWRPVVFMLHGLMNAMWMGGGALAGLRLFAAGALGPRLPVLGVPALPAVAAVVVTFILCKSMGAFLLIMAGLAALVAATRLRRSWLLLIIMLYPTFYVTTRGTGLWDAENLLGAVERAASSERAGSLEFRLRNENILAEKARERPLFGWGGWKRAWVRDESGATVSVPDGLWIIAFGQNGVFGLSALVALLLLPQLLFLRRYPVRLWREPAVAAMAPLSVLVGLFMLDNLLNDMFNPVMLLCAGGITGLCLRPPDDPASESGSAAGGESVVPPPPAPRAL
jgi:hypothetical protein